MGFISTNLQKMSRASDLKRLLKMAKTSQRLAGELAKEQSDARFTEMASTLDPTASLETRLSYAIDAARRSLKMTAFDVQVAGATVLATRAIAEMQTGEGKSLTGALGAAALAMGGRKVHIATVNDYLAGRDAEKFKDFYQILGLTVGHASSSSGKDDKKRAYAFNIVYATAQELAFDYLRDNIAPTTEGMVHCGLDALVIDEADSILLDEACTPLILSGMPKDEASIAVRLVELANLLQEDEHFSVDRKTMQVEFTEPGFDLVESWLSEHNLLPAGESIHETYNLWISHAVSSAVAARSLYRRDKEYMVVDNEIVIIDVHTGRALKGRRWSDGLHQAIEAKEGLEIKAEAPTLATITYQSFVSLYDTLSGLSGTAQTEEEELQSAYGLGVVSIPTHRPSQRIDEHDRLYQSDAERNRAVVAEIIEAQKRKQPVLVGTDSVETSELFAEELRKHGIKASVLNAKNHAQEAAIVAEAGAPGAVTIATQMAGRGTDIALGGSDLGADLASGREYVLNAGGLLVIGTSRSTSRRVDLQLRGRSGRQGDPGRSCFFLSVEDEFVSTFAGDKLKGIMSNLDVGEGEALESKLMDRIIRQAQASRERIDSEMRQDLMKYDSVLANQRATVYAVRNEWMTAMESKEGAKNREVLVEKSLQAGASVMASRHQREEWDPMKLRLDVARHWKIELQPNFHEQWSVTPENLADFLTRFAKAYYQHRQSIIDEAVLPLFEQVTILEGLDKAWTEHLRRMTMLRDGINLRAYANQNPRYAYQIEGGKLFETILDEAAAMASDTLLGALIPERMLQKAA